MCMFNPPSAQAQQMPPPPPMPVMPPDPPTPVDEGVKKARADAQNKARSSAGMTSTDGTKGALVGTSTGSSKTATGQ